MSHANPAPNNVQAAPTVPTDTANPASSALTIWRERLDYLLMQEAIAVDPDMKFRLKHLIDEAKAKIRELGGNAP